jgi:hypothetical protein
MVVATLTGSPCHLGVHDAGWAASGQSLPGTVVDGLFDRSQIGEGEGAQVAALGEVLAQEPVGVLVRAAQPWAGRRCEEDAVGELLLQQLVAGHLSEPRSQVRVCPARSGRPVNTGSIATCNCSALCPSSRCTSRR